MNPREIGMWLANADENEPCTDEDFAETMVYLYKYAAGDDTAITAEFMRSFDIVAFTEWLNKCLGEIIQSEEIDQSAWWKKGDD